MIILQLLIYCLLFTAMVKIAVIGGAVNGLYFYPKTVQDQAIELGLIDRNTMNRKRKRFMISFYIVMLAALVLIIGMWNRASIFGEAYWQALLFLEVMNVYDGVVIDKLWVGHSRFGCCQGLKMHRCADLAAGAEKAKHTGVDLGRRSGNCRRYCRFDLLRRRKLPK